MQAQAPRIRIALLGADEATPAIVRAIVESPRFELVGACELESAIDAELAHSLRTQLGRAGQFGEWEALLDQDLVDVVVVARAADDDRRAEQLRKLIQVRTPLVTSHPVVDSMLVYYELDMIRRETDCLILPYLPARHHPAVRALGEMASQGADSPLGKIEQVVFERSLSRGDKASILAQFARDADLIRAIAGDMTRLGAMASAHVPDSYVGLGVQMSGPSGVVARWSVDSVQGPRAAQLAVLGTRGKATVQLREDGRPWTMELAIAGQTSTHEYHDWDAPAAVLAEVDSALGGQLPVPGWVDAARSMELAETIDRSLLKGRTIELYYEDYTEEGTFKGTMTSVGCGLLVLALCLLGAVAIAEQAGLPYLRAWPYVLLGGLGVFLLLQLLMLVFRRDDARDEPPKATSGEPTGRA